MNLILQQIFFSLTVIQGGAERRRGRRSGPSGGLCLDQHAVLGGGLEVAQNNALRLPGGTHAQAVPPSKLFVCGVVLPVADGVAAEEPVCEIRLGGLMGEEVTLYEELGGIGIKPNTLSCEWEYVADLPRDSDAVSSEALQPHVQRRTFWC